MKEPVQPIPEQAWQAALDLRLTQQLMQPVVRPGLVRPHVAGTILARAQAMAGHLPLLGQVIQRHGTAEGLPAGLVPIVYAQQRPDDVDRASEATAQAETPPPRRPSVQARAIRRVEPSAMPVAGGLQAAVQRAAETGPTGAMPVVQAGVVRPGEPSATPVTGGLQAVVQRAAETGPAREMPVVQARAVRPGELGDKPAVVQRPGKAKAHQGQPASSPPTWPVVIPVGSTGETGMIQRSLDRLLVVETRHPGWPGSPAAAAFQRPSPLSNRGKLAGTGLTNGATEATVVQRATSGAGLSLPVVQRAPVETGMDPNDAVESIQRELDMEELVENVQRELDMEELVEKVQRRLRQRLAVESERKGWVQWP
jgi:hypothetical protein